MVPLRRPAARQVTTVPSPVLWSRGARGGGVMLPAIKTQRLRILMEHYLEVRGDRRMPSRRDIDALRLGPALPIIWMSEYEPAAGTFRYRLAGERSEEHTSELQSLMRTSYAVFCLKQNTQTSDSR